MKNTFDIQFNDVTGLNKNSMSLELSLQECKDYIEIHNGKSDGYFSDYKGGAIKVVCNQTGETVYEDVIK